MYMYCTVCVLFTVTLFIHVDALILQQQSAIPELINEAHEFHWEFLDSQ